MPNYYGILKINAEGDLGCKHYTKDHYINQCTESETSKSVYINYTGEHRSTFQTKNRT